MTATAVAAPPATRLDAPELAGFPQFLRPVVAVPGVYYGGFWIRLGVSAVDAAIQALLYLVLDYILGGIVGIVGGIAHFDSSASSKPVAVASLIIVYVYYSTTLVARASATPGMRICSLKIVNDADITVTPEKRTLYLRGAIWIVFSITGILRIVDALYIAIDPRKRSLHDLMVGTAVVRRAPSPPKVASLLCEVCGRPVDEGRLCPRHGGSVGLAITLSGHTVSLQIAASILALIGVVAVIVGIVMLITGTVLGAVGIVVGIALLRTTMALTQLRSWARWVGIIVGVLVTLGALVGGIAELGSSHAAGGFILAGAVVGALVVGCLWTPETYRSFRRVP